MLRFFPDHPAARVGLLLSVLAAACAVAASDLGDSYGFGPLEVLKLDWELGLPLAGDLNGDGLYDLVVCNNRKSWIELLLQKPGFDPLKVEATVAANPDNINDVFGRETAWRFQRFRYPLHVRATSLVLGDFNHDGRSDLAYYAPDGLHVVLQDRPPARSADSGLVEPSWQAETRFDLRDGLKTPEALTAGDLNHDGRTDLILLLQDGYYILLQTPDGRLAPPVRHYSSSERLRQAEIGDVDGDGRDDLVLLTAEQEEYPLRIRLQTPDGGLGPEGRYALPFPSALRLCRLSGSSRRVIGSVSQPSGRFALHALVGQERQNETISIHPLPADDAAAHRDMIGADVDGDGLADMVVTDPGRGQFLVLRGRPGSGLGPVTVYPGLKDMRKVRAARLDEGPGETLAVLSLDEKLIALSRFEGGRLCFPQTVAVVGEPQAMELADLDGDGEIDLAYIARGPAAAGAKSTGAGPFFLRSILSVGRATARPGPALELQGLSDKPQDLLACDIDHDGAVDLIVVRSYDPLLLVRRTADGAFQQQAEEQAQIGLVSNLSSRSLSVAPLGPQGRPALLAARGDFARSLYFDAETGWQVIDQYQASSRRHQLRVAAAVPDPAGQTLRIAAYDDTSGLLSFMDRQADGTYRMAGELDVGTAPVRKILTGHFRSPASQDLVLCADRRLICVRTGGKLALRQIAGFEPTIEKGRFGPFTMGDLNGDGVPDVVLCEQSRNHVQILSFDENARLTDAYRFKVFETHPHSRERQPGGRIESGEPRHVLVQDVTGDGRNDLVVLVHDRIIVYPQN
ncbi:MAG: VCBS repeat-containing protein [Planctomycetes bacterium]|nr:VCBS repeat-containing protein [Planctomycetota bacterium]